MIDDRQTLTEDELDAGIIALVQAMSASQVAEFIADLPEYQASEMLRLLNQEDQGGTALSPLAQAAKLVRGFAERPHLRYLSERIALALRDVEQGISRRIIIQMPPRSGKTLLATQVTAAWTLARHPEWPVALTSYSGTLATSWGRQVRRWTDEGLLGPQVKVAPDAGAASGWETTEGGAFHSRSLREPLTGFGAKVLIIDDPHKDFADVHSKTSRDAVWNWYTSVALTRLHPPSLVILTLTRWHEDDLAGRLLSDDYDGDPEDWEVISFPAIAETNDVLGREVGQPLYSPLVDETEEVAIERWAEVKRAVGTYVWSAMYQQHPSPAKGTIFSTDWIRYWTNDPKAVTENVHYLDPDTLASATWLDSWDLTFDSSDNSDYVVGQRWAKVGANRYLMAQQRERWNFTETIAAMLRWAKKNALESPWGQHVHKRLVEKKANGAAAITTLREKVAGIKPITPVGSKEVRARAVTPEIESGNVYLPHWSMPGYAWVRDVVAEMREFPNGAHDDTVDALTQALLELRGPGRAGIAKPGGNAQAAAGSLPQTRTGAATSMRRR